jgi:hypothetical protein
MPKISPDSYNAIAADQRWLTEIVHDMRTMLTGEVMQIMERWNGARELDPDTWNKPTSVRTLPSLYLHGDNATMLYPAFNDRKVRVEYTYGNNFHSKSTEYLILDYSRIWEALCQPLALLYPNQVPYDEDMPGAITSIDTDSMMKQQAQYYTETRHWHHVTAAVDSLIQPPSQRRTHRRVPFTADHVPYDISRAVTDTTPYRSANTRRAGRLLHTT